MERADQNLAFILRYENIAWYESGAVRILDRRVYPLKTQFVTCNHHTEVAQAIKDMVTQSAGPFLAAAMGMALAAFEARDRGGDQLLAYLEEAASRLCNARPTTKARMTKIVTGCLDVARQAILEGKRVDEAIFAHNISVITNRYKLIGLMAKHLVDVFPDKGTIMTQCFAETIVGLMLNEARSRGKDIKVICPETRPYLQGARLTASVACDQGFEVTVITDNMPGYAMKAKGVDLFTSAADVICMDGHIVNKVGTFQIALAAAYWGIPFFATGTPDRAHATVETVTIEERSEREVLEFFGTPTTLSGVKGFYPAFDITPPKLVNGVVTVKGIFSPYDLNRYYLDNDLGEY